jgi:hypothetical protein
MHFFNWRNGRRDATFASFPASLPLDIDANPSIDRTSHAA